MKIEIDFYKNESGYGIYIGDNVGGSGIKVEGKTPQTLFENLKPYLLDYIEQAETECEDGENEHEFESYGLDKDQEKIACRLYYNNEMRYGNYTLESVDRETLQIWAEDADDEEYKEFLEEALENFADVYSLTDNLGGWSQRIGEIAFYD